MAPGERGSAGLPRGSYSRYGPGIRVHYHLCDAPPTHYRGQRHQHLISTAYTPTNAYLLPVLPPVSKSDNDSSALNEENIAMLAKGMNLGGDEEPNAEEEW